MKISLRERERLLWGVLVGEEKLFSSVRLRCLWVRLEREGKTVVDFWARPEKFLPDTPEGQEQCLVVRKLQNEGALEKLAAQLRQHHWQIILLGDPSYPVLLKFIPDQPLVLFVAGEPASWQRPCLAVVGSRRVSDYGRTCVWQLINQRLAGMSIVSGMMTGVDVLAHERALSQGLPTVAVLGYGLAHTWPYQVMSIRERILGAGGSLISEYAPNCHPTAWRFPKRNRLVAGLSLATLVIEAALKSGSLITARLALDYGREVLAVPGAITSNLSAGTNQLIQNGAWPITSGEEISDIAKSLPLWSLVNTASNNSRVGETQATKQKTPLIELINPRQQQIYQLLTRSPLPLEELAQKLDLPLPILQTTLSMLELEGLIQRDDLGKFAVVL